MFQLLGVGLVGGVKTRFGREKNKKSAVNHPGHSLCLFPAMAIYIQVFVSAPFIVSICFFGNKALGECWTLGNYIYNSAPNMKNARHFQSCPNLCNKDMFQ